MTPYKILFKQGETVIRSSINFSHGLNIDDPDSPPSIKQIRLLIKLGYKGKVPPTTGHADYEIKRLEGNLEEFPEIKTKYEGWNK